MSRRWTTETLLNHPNFGKLVLKQNDKPENHRAGAVAKLERDSRHESLAAHQGKKGAAAKLLVRFVSVRKRLLDPDNVAVKWTLDSLRYAGIISGDEPDKIALEISQRKVGRGESEKTEIEILTL